MSLLAAVLETVIKHGLWNFDSPLVLAVSGGRDSMVLLHVLKLLAINPQKHLFVAHVDHAARKNSIQDAKFVEKIAIQNGLPCFCLTIKPWQKSSGESAESYWRKKRYAVLQKLRIHLRADAIATAHTASDHLETLLLRITSGTGPRGFLGIRTYRDDAVIRPVIDVTRKEITDYALAKGISWLDDPSNKNISLPRNAIRSHIIPVLQSLNPEVDRAAVRASRLLQKEDILLSRWANKILSASGWQQTLPAILQSSSFVSEPEAIVNRCAAALYEDISNSFRVVSDHIHRLANCLTGKLNHCPIPGGGEARYEGNRIIIVPGVSDEDRFRSLIPKSSGVSVVGAYDIMQENVPEPEGSQVIKSSKKLIVRTRLPGDHRSSNCGGKKISLSEYFRTHKIPVILRDYLPLLVEKSGRVIWVADPTSESCIYINNGRDPSLKLTCWPRSAIR